MNLDILDVLKCALPIATMRNFSGTTVYQISESAARRPVKYLSPTLNATEILPEKNSTSSHVPHLHTEVQITQHYFQS